MPSSSGSPPNATQVSPGRMTSSPQRTTSGSGSDGAAHTRKPPAANAAKAAMSVTIPAKLTQVPARSPWISVRVPEAVDGSPPPDMPSLIAGGIQAAPSRGRRRHPGLSGPTSSPPRACCPGDPVLVRPPTATPGRCSSIGEQRRVGDWRPVDAHRGWGYRPKRDVAERCHGRRAMTPVGGSPRQSRRGHPPCSLSKIAHEQASRRRFCRGPN
jgi:hypothetical protein